MNDETIRLAIESLMKVVGRANGVEITTIFKEDENGNLLRKERKDDERS